MSGREGGSVGSEFTSFKGYEYRSNANLVLHGANRARNTNEPTGEAETLRGKQLPRFGDRALTSKAPVDDAKKKKKRPAEGAAGGRAPKRPRNANGAAVLEGDALEGIRYQPKTRDTRLAYEGLLNMVAGRVGDQAQSVIMSAADEVLAVLKDEEVRPTEKKAILQEVLGALTDDEYSTLYKHASGITDYQDVAPEEDAPAADEEGIAVVFGDDDEDEDEGVYELDEDEDADEGADEPMNQDGPKDKADQGEEEEEALRLDPQSIDAYWLQRELSKFYDDAVESQKMAVDVMRVLDSAERVGDVENELVELLGYERFDYVKYLLHNRNKIVYVTKLAQAQSDAERASIESKMNADPELAHILAVLKGKVAAESATLGGRMRKEARSLAKQDSMRARRERELQAEAMELVDEHKGEAIPISEYIDLTELSFRQGAHLMTNKQCKLPEGSFQKARKGFEEVVIPASKAPPFADDEALVRVGDLPKWVQPAFEGVRELNRIQSRLYKKAFGGGDNLLLCAPTGGGKTNVAMLTMLHEIGRHINEETLKVDLTSFKIVYIAPMKSLVQEMVFNFGKRLKPYGITCGELTGDVSMTKEQIDNTQVIFTTPEKWDIITRKSGERTYTELVRLVIIDEVHLLHDSRGPVLESIVARTIRGVESTQQLVRIIGLSATLPNYQDVATFLRIKPENLFAFPNSFRPIPLELSFVGINVKKPFKRFQLMNEICYEKVSEHAGANQVLVFVHSRKETVKTAKMLRDQAVEDGTIGKYLGPDPATREILMQEAEGAKNADLKDLLPYGFAIHHAGMTREDRTLVEDLFADKHIQVLVSTATLAWGVNLPAHAVIIKGTKVYNPEISDWIELSGLDVMQMLGRAGRPGYDTKGQGCLITGRTELQFYLSLMSEQLPIESQYISKLADNLNAEIVLGTIQNVKDAVNWLGYTYLYVCMLRSPELYGIAADVRERDRTLLQRRYDLIHSAASVLAKHNLIKYDRKSGSFQVTDLGRIASHYYLTPYSMSIYNEHLKITTGDIELLRIFSLSEEFKNCAVRPDERMELKKLMERVPIPIKESIEDASAKINVLFQSYVSRLSLDGFSLASDMVYVKQSAGRIMRALFEIALKRGWAAVAEKCLKWCQMIERRMWSTQSPLRQFKALPADIIKKLEKKDLTVERLYDLDSHEIGEGIEFPSLGKQVYTLVHNFPRLDLSAAVQPITRSLLLVDLTLTPDFKFDEKYHGTGLAFWVIVEDVDGDRVLHSEMFILKKKYAEEDHQLTFTVPLYEPMPPQYFIKVVCDRWLGSVSTLPVSFRNLILPEKYPPHTDLLDLQPLPVAALKNAAFEPLFKAGPAFFNPIQTQTFNALYNTDHNVIVCAPAGSGLQTCAEFAVLREFQREQPGCIVFIEPKASVARERARELEERFGQSLGKKVELLTGEWTVDTRLMKSDIVVATPEIWDMTSRKWKQRKQVAAVRLYVVNDIHLIGSAEGATLEVAVSRIRYIAHQLKAQAQDEKSKPITRICAFATSLANAKDIGEWIGATPNTLFNFHPNVRPVPLEIHMQGFDHPHFKTRMESMNKLLLYSMAHHAEDKPAIIWVPSRAIARQVARDVITHANASESPQRYLHASPEDLAPLLKHVKSKVLAESLSLGVGFFHEAMTENEREIVLQLFTKGAIQIVVATHNMCWDFHGLAHLVVVMGTEFYDGKQHSYVDYPMTDLLQMIGKAGRPNVDSSAKCIVFGYARKKEFYKKFIYEPLPVESYLDHFLHDHINAEIVTKTIENKQDAVDYLTWTFFYRRLTQNPNFYNLKGVSNRHVSDYLSELIESTIADLEKAQCIAVDVDELGVSALNLGLIAAHYNVRYNTIELFNDLLEPKLKIRGLLEIISHATEFDSLAIRHKEADVLAKMAAHLPMKISKPDYHSTGTKVNVLLQSHFSRKVLTPDLAEDQSFVLRTAPRLLQALVDVVSSKNWLNQAIAAMELSQMIVQAMWDSDSPLKQLPHVTTEVLERFSKEEPQCTTIPDLLDLDDKRRLQLLSPLMERTQLADVARAANRYPNIEVQHEVQGEDELKAGAPMRIAVQLEREMDEDEKLGPVHAPFFPAEKIEGWWLILGDPEQNKLFALKKISFNKPTVVNALEFEAPPAGRYKAFLYLMSDSYIGCDQEFPVAFKVQEGEDKMETD